MKFGREFEVQMIQEWREAYMDYLALKAILKQLLRFRQQHPTSRPSSSTAAAAGATCHHGGAGALMRRVTLYRAFSGLTNCVNHNNNNRFHSHGNNNHHHHFFDDDDEEQQVILINEDETTASYKTTFLSSGGEGEEYDVIFFRRLDGEFNKVLKFYREKVEQVMEEADELSRQLNVLIALRIKVENPIMDLPDINGDTSHSSSTPVPSVVHQRPAASPMAVIEEVKENEEENSGHVDRKKGFKPAPLEVLDRVKINIEPETPLSMVKCMIASLTSDKTFSKSELKKAEELMARAFIEFYQKLRLLKSYCFLNQLAFSKILKKYDKITLRNASKAYLHTVDNSYLGSCDEVSRLMTRVEATYIKHFANGNRHEGMKSLRPKAKRQRHRVTYFLGFLSGCAVALIVAIVVLVHIRGLTHSEGRHQYMENIFPLYSLFGFIALHLLMYAANIYFWSRFRVNYPFIFGFEQGTELGYREVLLIGSGLIVLTFAGVISNLDMETDPRTKSFSVITEIVPLTLLIILVLITFCPFNIIYRSSRYFLVSCIFRCMLAPLYKVTLPDFFLADQLTSQVQAFRSLLFYTCYYGWGDFKRRSNKCYESHVYRDFYLAVAIIPYWLRFAQCIRRLVEEKDKMHGLNATKYLSTIVAVVTRTTFEMRKGTYWLTMAATTSSIATVINTAWDLFMDWGLMRRHSKNPWLRDKLLVPYKSIYFIAMVVNVVLRLAWMQTVLGIREAPFLHQRALSALVACLEIIRRGIWNFFRLENEHLNNVGNFRAFKSVPLPFHYQEIGETKSM